MRGIVAVIIASLLSACVLASAPTPSVGARRTIDIAAEQYVRLALEIDTHEPGYVDAYYGPGDWREQARAHPRSIDDLKRFADHIAAQLQSVADHDTDATSRRRARTLAAYVASARFRLDMIEGVRVPFVEEAERLFALRPEIRPLESYDAALARLDAIVPGEGPLAQRVEAFSRRFIVPHERADAVMRAAIDECRRRTVAHLPLPEYERFDFEFVTGQSWGAYNWYQGDNRSLIQVNMDLPLMIGSAVGYGCHEGYPGHHVQGIAAERLYRERGWVEFSIMPLFSPQGPLNEGGGNYGVELAFPDDERLRFEQDVLFPLAGLNSAEAPAYYALLDALAATEGAGRTIVSMYLNGEIDRAHAIELLQRYRLSSGARAEQTLDFADHYRSYVINYTSGLEVVRAYAERAGDSQEARWAAYARILNEPTLPSDLTE